MENTNNIIENLSEANKKITLNEFISNKEIIRYAENVRRLSIQRGQINMVLPIETILATLYQNYLQNDNFNIENTKELNDSLENIPDRKLNYNEFIKKYKTYINRYMTLCNSFGLEAKCEETNKKRYINFNEASNDIYIMYCRDNINLDIMNKLNNSEDFEGEENNYNSYTYLVTIKAPSNFTEEEISEYIAECLEDGSNQLIVDKVELTEL